MEEQKTPQHIPEPQIGKKERMRREASQRRTMKSIRNWGIAVVIIGGVVYGLYALIQSAAPQEEDFSRALPLLEASHIPVGSPTPEYNSNPPSSGPHYAQTARSGFRTEAIPDENIVHNLEHGDVWIAYHPRVSDTVKQNLKQFAAAKVIITPREANDTDIALVAWGRIDTFNLSNGDVSETRIRDFVTRYLNKGPEKISGASGGI